MVQTAVLSIVKETNRSSTGAERERRAERSSSQQASRHGSGSSLAGAKFTIEGRLGPNAGAPSMANAVGGSGSGQRGGRGAESGAPSFEDWETSDEHLGTLEHRLSEWHSLVDSLAPNSARRSNAPAVVQNPNVPTGVMAISSKASMVPKATAVGWTDQRHAGQSSARMDHRHSTQSAGEVQKLRRFKPDVCSTKRTNAVNI